MVFSTGPSAFFQNPVLQEKINPSRFHKLSHSVSPLAIIETTRFLAIVGLVCSAFASVLLPSLAFATIAAVACVLKNRVTQVEQVARPSLSRPGSIMKQTIDGTNPVKKNSVRLTGTSPMIVKESLQGITPIDIKDTFLGSLGPEKTLSLTDRYELLTVCYSYLFNKQDSIPKYLNRPWKWLLLKKIDTNSYLENKYKHFLKETSENFQQSIKDDQGKKILETKDSQKVLESAPASLIMEIVQELHEKISQEKKAYQDEVEAKRHAENAIHAGAYIQQFKDFENKNIG